ncbi:amino acid ABC transporter permease [Oceanospirillum maris]|jgi:general L-amino acid transport system permease protein|uniref:amino acid ABC transporter permease n=1 Tax=Oceanospirillum maris TaxID=64977 RepID=UPI00042A86BB|nr:amino acid ABC transporter permease [Oceanospirillum maris]
MQSDAKKSQSASTHKTRFWHDPAKRALLFQGLLILGVFSVVGLIVQNTLQNLESRGITTGFDFLSQRAGFGIVQSLVEYTESSSYGQTFLVGLMNTILVSAMGIIAATIIGFIMGVARLSNNWLISKIASAYVEIFRNIPLLLQIFFWYFAVLRGLPSPRQSFEPLDNMYLNVRGLFMPEPIYGVGFGWVVLTFMAAVAGVFVLARWSKKRQDKTGQSFPVFWTSIALVIGLPLIVYWLMGSPLTWENPELRGFNFKGGMTIIPELAALWVALSIYTAAFIAEIVRSGIEAISKGQTEAAEALGLSSTKVLRLVVIPQSVRIIIPPLTSQYLNLIKNSSLATAIGYPDLVSVFAGTTLNQTGQAIEVIFMTMLVYLTLSLLVSSFMNWFNNRMALVER